MDVPLDGVPCLRLDWIEGIFNRVSGGGGGANCRELGDKKILPSGIQKWKDSREKRLLQKEL